MPQPWETIKNYNLGRWSFSKLITAETCPRLFQHTYLNKKQEFYISKDRQYQAVTAKVGGTIHSIMEKALPAPDKFTSIWASEVKDRGLTFEEISMANALKYQSEQIIRRLNLALVKWHGVPATEMKLKTDTLVSILDLVIHLGEGGAVIIDYKTHGEHKKKSKKVKEQLSFYALMLFLLSENIKSIKTGCAYIPDASVVFNNVLARDKDFPRLDKLWFTRFNKAAKAMRTLVQAKTPVFPIPSRKTDMCGWCQVQDCLKKQTRKTKRKGPKIYG